MPRHLHAIHHLPHLGELGKLSWNISIGSLAGSMGSIFVPIYLYAVLGYALPMVFVYFAAIGLTAVALHFLGGWLLRYIGGHKLMVLSDILDSVAMILLATAPQLNWPLLLIAFFKGSGKGLYWPAFHASFSQHRNRSRAGRQISALSVLLMIMTGLAPALGGFIGSVFSLSLVYVFVVVLTLISMLPQLVGPDESRGYRVQFGSIPWRKVMRDYISGFSYTVSGIVDGVLWPLAIYLLIPSYASVGALSSLVLLASVFVALYVGRREERKGAKRYLREGSWLQSATSALRLVSQSTSMIAGVNFLTGIINALVYTPFTTRYYTNADSERRVEYVIGMEVAHSLGWMTFSIFMVIALILLPLPIAIGSGLLLGVPAAFGMRLIR